MSAIFQRPLCEMGAAFDFAFRPLAPEPDPSLGGPCDDRPHRVELYASSAGPGADAGAYRTFSLCPEHESQLRGVDARLVAAGRTPRFRGRPGASPASAHDGG